MDNYTDFESIDELIQSSGFPIKSSVDIDNLSAVRRLGYLCDRIGLEIALPPSKSKKYLLLDPTMPPTGFVDPKWRLIINLDSISLEELE